MLLSQKIAITGINGVVGSVVSKHLGGDWMLTGIDTNISDSPSNLQMDIADQAGLTDAFREAHAVIHLAVADLHSGWETVFPTNFLGVKAVFEAARIAGVKKIIFASSNHVTGLYENDEPYKAIIEGRYPDAAPIPYIDHEFPIRPDTPYGVSKAFGEAIGRYYSEVFGIQVICLRIGTLNRENRPLNKRHLATLVTHSDFISLLLACLNQSTPLFDIFYVVSNNTWRFWDLAHSESILGWQPRDNAEHFRSQLSE